MTFRRVCDIMTAFTAKLATNVLFLNKDSYDVKLQIHDTIFNLYVTKDGKTLNQIQIQCPPDCLVMHHASENRILQMNDLETCLKDKFVTELRSIRQSVDAASVFPANCALMGMLTSTLADSVSVFYSYDVTLTIKNRKFKLSLDAAYNARMEIKEFEVIDGFTADNETIQADFDRIFASYRKTFNITRVTLSPFLSNQAIKIILDGSNIAVDKNGTLFFALYLKQTPNFDDPDVSGTYKSEYTEKNFSDITQLEQIIKRILRTNNPTFINEDTSQMWIALHKMSTLLEQLHYH